MCPFNCSARMRSNSTHEDGEPCLRFPDQYAASLYVASLVMKSPRWRSDMRSRQWLLLLTLAAAFYDVGTIWMVQLGYWLWPHVAPADFGHYHGSWAVGILPVIFPAAGVAFAGSIAMLRWRPLGVPAWAVWLGATLQVVAWGLTAVLWGPIQANLHFATL